MVIATEERHPTKSEARFCVGSNPACELDLLRTFFFKKSSQNLPEKNIYKVFIFDLQSSH